MKPLILLLSLLLAACTTCPFGCKSTAKGKIEHIVLVWLKRRRGQRAVEE